MVESEGLDPDDIVVIPNGIAAVDSPPRAEARERFRLKEGDRAIGTVGHLRPEKAFELLIEAAAVLREREPSLRVLIAGEGPERAMLEALIDARGLEGVVELLGGARGRLHLLAALDVAVCCSDFEGGPLSVMEYMRAGLPSWRPGSEACPATRPGRRRLRSSARPGGTRGRHRQGPRRRRARSEARAGRPRAPAHGVRHRGLGAQDRGALCRARLRSWISGRRHGRRRC